MKRSLVLLTLGLLFTLIPCSITAQTPAAPPAAVQGILVDIVKDENTPTGSLVVAVAQPNLSYAFYEGSFLQLPDFTKLKAKYSGQMYGFDLALALQHDNYAMLFQSYLKIDKEGTYRFYLTSDDGSNLLIDSKLIVNNDGVHPPTMATGEVKLSPGMHRLQVGFFQHFGGVDLRLQFEGPGVPKQSIVPHLFLSPNATPAAQ